MQLKRSLILGMLIVTLTTAQEPVDVKPIVQLRQSYEEKLGILQSKFLEDVRVAQADLVSKLEEMIKEQTAKGDLDRVLLLRAEKTRVEAFQPVPKGVVSAFLQQPRLQFEGKIVAARAAYDKEARAAHLAYLVSLDNYVKDETKAGRVDDAIAAREIRKSLEKQSPPSPVMPGAEPGNTVVIEPPKPTAIAAPTGVLQPPTGSRLVPGLLVREYPYRDGQNDKNPMVDLESFTDPIGRPYVIGSLNWKYTQSRNAVATGFLKITKAGEYVFNSNNFYDRNALYIDGKLVCRYRDGENKREKVTLPVGYIPIQSIGAVDARGTVRVKWLPPGELELSDVPANLLFHQPVKK